MTTISFDLDGVVIRNPFARCVVPRVRAAIRTGPALRDLDPGEADRRIDRAIRSAWGERMARGDFVGAYHWDAIYGEVSRSFGGGEVPDVATLVRQCCGEEGMIALLPGVAACLTSLRAEGFTLVAATNGYYAYQWPVLEALSVSSQFERLLSPDTLGFAKPFPEYFAGVPGLVAHVGDILEHDVLGANLAGLVSVWLAPELPDALRALPLAERSRHPAFEPFFARALETALYRQYHAGATETDYVPDLVAYDIGELPTALGRVLVERGKHAEVKP